MRGITGFTWHIRANLGATVIQVPTGEEKGGQASLSSPDLMLHKTKDTLLADTEGQTHDNQHRIHASLLLPFIGAALGVAKTWGFISALPQESESICPNFLASICF